jgi:anthranilate phosphoribosyltransferase
MDMQSAIRRVIDRGDLNGSEMTEVMRTIMTGAATPAQIGAFMVGLRMKGEAVDEIAAAARVMRALAARVEVAPEHAAHLVDTCGTGGDGVGTFNISTTAAFVAAGAEARVAKHGNRSVSSKSGSADLLEAAGVALSLSPTQVARCIEEVGLGFMFAPQHHGAMRHAIGPRREIGARTLFNLLGPLTNPAAAPNQVLGVFAAEWVEPLARVLQQLGSRHVMVVHADDGLDEISIGAPTRVAELKHGQVHSWTLRPEDLGVAAGDVSALAVNGVEQSLERMYEVLDDRPGPARDIVVLNAGAAIYTAGLAEDPKQGVELARRSLAEGAARAKLEALRALTRRLEGEA